MRRALAAFTVILAIAGVSHALAAPADASKRPPRSFFSVGPQALIDRDDVERMGLGGIGRLRLPFAWSAADPVAPAGELNWQTFDGVIGEAARNGITILPVLYGTPTWVAGLDGRQCYPNCQLFLPTSDAGRSAFQTFVSGAVARYGPDGEYWLAHPELIPHPIRVWQVWNEQNSGQYTQPQPSVRPYARLLNAASRAIHYADPGAKVILGGMYHDPVSSTVRGLKAVRYLRQLYRRPGIEKRFEGIAIHPYSAYFSRVRNQVKQLRRVARQAGDPRVTSWITEIGWSSGGIRHPLNKGMKGQARFLSRSFRLFIRNRRRWRVRVVSWFSWRDSGQAAICKWCPESGLFEAEPGFLPKPAWHKFTRFSGGI